MQDSEHSELSNLHRMSGCKTLPNAAGTGELQFRGGEVHRLLKNAQKPGWHSKPLGGGGVFAETSQTLLHSHPPAQAKAKLDKILVELSWWNFGLPGLFYFLRLQEKIQWNEG